MDLVKQAVINLIEQQERTQAQAARLSAERASRAGLSQSELDAVVREILLKFTPRSDAFMLLHLSGREIVLYHDHNVHVSITGEKISKKLPHMLPAGNRLGIFLALTEQEQPWAQAIVLALKGRPNGVTTHIHGLMVYIQEQLELVARDVMNELGDASTTDGSGDGSMFAKANRE